MKVALVGNPNCGKTLLFNRLTGENMAVGNRAGVTVEVKRGEFSKGEIYDLPGVYSLKTAENEEKIAADFLSQGRADYIVNVADPKYLSRSLLLTMQLAAYGIPTVLAVNMRDEAEKRKIEVDVGAIERILGCPTIFFSARKDDNFDDIFLVGKTFGSSLPDEPEKLFSLAESIGKTCVRFGKTKKFSPDKFLLSERFALPIFLFVMTSLLFGCSCLSSLCGRLFDFLLGALREFLKTAQLPFGESFLSLVTDGIFCGVGGVLQFLPPLFLLTFCLNLMEDSGYLSRIAFLADKLFASFGASGRSAVSLILACGCTVPAVMSARTIPDREERRRLTFWVHLVPCNAKLPLFSLFVAEIFGGNIFVLPLTYLFSVLLFFAVNLLKKPYGKSLFIMELPEMKFPDIPVCAKRTALSVRGFLFRVCTVVFLASLAVWVLSNYDFGFRKCEIEDSILLKTCDIIKYVFYPIGLTENYFAAAILSGFAGKETVVGVLQIVCHGDISAYFTLRQGIVFYLFIMISAPCAAALTAIKRELGRREFIRCFLSQTLLAYIIAGAVNLVLMLLGF